MDQLFFETVSMMAIRGYNTLPFQFLFDLKMKNNRHIENGELDQVVNIPHENLLSIINNIRTINFQIEESYFEEGKNKFSMIFNHCYDGMTTLVLFSDDDKLTSKDTIKNFLTNQLKKITQVKTGSSSNNPFLKENKVSCILVLKSGISSFSKTFINEIPTIEILTEIEILSRTYDSCLQSHITTTNPEEKNRILFEVGLNENKIPSVKKNDDILCRVLNLNRNDLMISTRRNISEEELDYSVFLRNIK